MAYYNGNYRGVPRQAQINYPTVNHIQPVDMAKQTANCLIPSECCPAAMAYVPWQTFDEVYDADKAFMYGTVFPCLNKPFLAGGKCK